MSNSNKVSIDNLSSQLMKYLQEFKEDIDDEVKETSDKIIKEATKELKQVSPEAKKIVYLRKSHSKFGVGDANWQMPRKLRSILECKKCKEI